jgi:hypothetical protein
MYRDRDIAIVTDRPTFMSVPERLMTVSELFWSETVENAHETVESTHGTLRNVQECSCKRRSNALERIVENVHVHASKTK